MEMNEQIAAILSKTPKQRPCDPGSHDEIIQHPTVHMISEQLIDPEEAKKIVRAQGGKPRQDYGLRAGGYHVIRVVSFGTP